MYKIVPTLGVLILAATGCGAAQAATDTPFVPDDKAVVDHRQPLPTIASRETSIGGKPATLSLNEVRRRGDLIEITYTIRDNDQGPRYNAGGADNIMSLGQLTNGGIVHMTMDKVSVIDPVNKKRYPVATDSQGDCVCTSYDDWPSIYPGQSLILQATTGAPPSDIKTVDVSIGSAGMFNDVQL